MPMSEIYSAPSLRSQSKVPARKIQHGKAVRVRVEGKQKIVLSRKNGGGGGI